MAPSVEALGFALVASAASVLPLSASAHSALLGLLFEVDPEPATTLAVAFGTWLAVVVAFRRVVAAALAALVRRPSASDAAVSTRDATALVMGSIAGLLVELAVRRRAAAWADEPVLLGIGLLVSAVALVSTYGAPKGSLRLPTVAGAVVVGAVQGASLLPGLSRTGLGLACLAWLGVAGEGALDACFLLLTPAGAGLLIVLLLENHGAWGPAHGLVAAVSFGAAWLAIRALRLLLRRGLLPLVSLYLVPLGIATLAWGYARP